MAKLNPNALIGALSGKLGALVFVPAQDGNLIVRQRPVRKAKLTQGERLNHTRFRAALAYVSGVRRQPEIYAHYLRRAALVHKRACDLAHADYTHPPVIQDIDLQGYDGGVGAPIRISATDDFEVVSVCVTLASMEGILIEVGEAQLLPDSSIWTYLALKNIPTDQALIVHVTALDRPGNSVIKSAHWIRASS